jgi:hypothetical protein
MQCLPQTEIGIALTNPDRRCATTAVAAGIRARRKISENLSETA